MKVVILAGGFGTRISEESHLKPKPMIEIGEKPILWHIMKYYSEFGYHDFVICLGYKQYVVKEFFADYFLHTSDVTFDLANNSMEVHNNYSEPWKVTLVDTGLNTMTGGRVKRIQPYIGNELAAEGQMKSFYHGGFWQCMDTQREMKKLEELWQSGKAPWKIWKD